MREEEIWLPVKGYEGIYEISSLGRVRSLPRDVIKGKGRGLHHLPQRVLRSRMVANGYLQVTLYKDGKYKQCLVHRLVARAFLDNPNNLPQVNHRDENKMNNAVTNLEWCTAKTNSNHGTRNARISKPVQQFSLDGRLIAVWPSAREAERVTEIGNSNISKCCNGRYHTAGGFIWKYAE